MRISFFTTFVAVLAISSTLSAQQIRGDYLESRSADVYTGQCFANGEVNLVGNEAIMAWRIQSGSWNGVSLEGLTVAAAIRASATLGDPYANPDPVQSVLMVDEQASVSQREALVAFAHHMAGPLLRNASQVIPTTMELAVNRERHGVAWLRAGQFATIQTRSLNEHVGLIPSYLR